MLEARCGICGETFTPNDVDDLEHVERRDGTPCGHTGFLTRGGPRTLAYDEVQVGQQVIAISRENQHGTVVSKFIGGHDPRNPNSWHEFVKIEFNNGAIGFNYPQQLILDTAVAHQ